MDIPLFDFEKTVEKLHKAVKHAYSMRRKNRGKDIPWDGPGLDVSLLATSYDIKEQFSAENLKYDEIEQARDALTIILGVAIQLGYSQALAIQKNKGKLLEEIEAYLSKVEM